MKRNFIVASIFFLTTGFIGNNSSSIALDKNEVNKIDLNPSYLEKIPSHDYILGPGDQINIIVSRDYPELTSNKFIDGEGTIYLPLLNRVYVSGLSMGGMGTFEILSQRPDMFAAATPISGSGDLNKVKNYAKKLPIWIFHGSLDKVVLPKESLDIAKKIIEQGGNPRLTLYENVGHDSWNDAFEEKDFLSWIHSKSK